jgi:acetyl esterase
VQLATMIDARRTRVTPVAAVEDRVIEADGRAVKVRIYRPHGEGPYPGIIYFHGGGHVIGSPDTHDEITRGYCDGTGAVVVSVDYAKGPEQRFPAAVEDVAAVLTWWQREARSIGGDGARLAVSGDSAGGNLAAVAALIARDRGMPMALQVLVYPIADYGLTADSYRRYADGYGILTEKAMQWFRDHYLGTPADAEDWRASPIKASSLAGVAPALILSAECDVLFDDGVAYAEALRRAGVVVTHKIYDGVLHGFFAIPSAIPEARAAQALAIAALNDAFEA